MEFRQVDLSSQQSPIQLVMEHGGKVGGTLVGTAKMRRGEQVPATGASTHPADEYSYVLRGRVEVEVGGRQVEASTGTLMVIPAGQGHITRALDDAEVLWWWVGHHSDFDGLKQVYSFSTDHAPSPSGGERP